MFVFFQGSECAMRADAQCNGVKVTVAHEGQCECVGGASYKYTF